MTVPRPTRHIPLRSCIVCGRKTAKRDLVRIVRSLDGRVEVDPTGKKSGRGVYLCRQEACWGKGLKRGRMEYALRGKILEENWREITAFAETLNVQN